MSKLQDNLKISSKYSNEHISTFTNKEIIFVLQWYNINMFIEKFIKTKEKFKNKIAIHDTTGNKKFTYEQLYEMTMKIAFCLKNESVTVGDFVTVELQNSPQYFAARFAVWAVGAVFVALSDKTPPKRKSYIYKDCKPKIKINSKFIKYCLSQTNTLNKKEIAKVNPKKDKAMIIYTSGTTGTPKGVLHTYQSLDKMIERVSKAYKFSVQDIHATFASTEFIGSILNDMLFTLRGNTLYIVPDEYKHDLHKLYNFILKNKINNMFLFSSVLKYLNLEQTSIKNIIVGGARCEKVFSEKFNIINTYGSSETGIYSFFKIDKLYNDVPIGKCPTNEKIYILDANLKPAKKGEIYFAGYIADCYLNQKTKSEQTFIKNPFQKNDGFPYLFKSGDLGKIDKNNNLLFINRLDMMVKINGQRVEPGEIESSIKKFNDIEDVCVKGVKYNDSMCLVAFYVSKKIIDKNKFDTHLKKYVPSYMIPRFYQKVNEIPKNKNGKIDYSKLVLKKSDTEKDTYKAPKTKLEKQICLAFEQSLNKPRIGIDDDFFNIGGDSLTAISMQSIIPEISYELLVAYKTPRAIALQLLKNLQKNYNFKYTLKSGTPLTQSQLYMYYDYILNECHFPYTLNFNLEIPKNTSTDEVYKAIYSLIDIHPILRARFAYKNNKPWIYYDGSPVVINSNCKAQNINIEIGMSIFFISKNQVEVLLHHYICDAISIDILKRDFCMILNNERPAKDNIFLKIPVYENYEQKSAEARDLNNTLKSIYKGYKYPNLILDFPFQTTTKVWQNIMSIKPKFLDILSKKHNVPAGIVLMGAYTNAVMFYAKDRDVAFNYIINGRKFRETSNAVSSFAQRNIMRFCVNDLNNYININEFYSLYLKINTCSLYNAWTTENKFNIHTDLFFNYVESNTKIKLKKETEFNSNLGISRNFMGTFIKYKNYILGEFVAPSYCNSKIIKAIFYNTEKIIEGLANNIDFKKLKLFSNSSSQNNCLQDYKLDKTFLACVKNAFKKCFPENKININSNFNKLGGSEKQALFISREIKNNINNINITAVDIIRYKTPKNITKRLLLVKDRRL